MASVLVKRRLAAILATDVVGYSHLMERDEAGTLAALKAVRRDVFDPAIAHHGGRVVKLMGDGALVEFASVVNAVECAVAIQRAMTDRGRAEPPNQRIVLRIGINVGDVISEGDDIYGNGVNIAARLEGQAPPGGICVSGAAHEQVEGKVAIDFVDIGELHVKNIDRPVHGYVVVPTSGTGAPDPMPASANAAERPFVAILPLTNMSGEAEQEYFADGFTEDLITELSRFQTLAVIARNSTFTYKGRSARVQDVGRELGVRYVVEGSIRKLGDRVRITIQLVDAQSGAHIWAERYDRPLTDIFALQDELVQAIVATISGRLELAAAGRAKSKPTTDLNAYDCVMQARLCHHQDSREANTHAMDLLDTAIRIDPDCAAAYAWRVCVMGQAWANGWRAFNREESNTALTLLHHGLVQDENDLECLRIMCEYYMECRQHEAAERYHERAFRLNPNDPRIVAQRGELLTWRGRPVDGITWIERALRLDPFGADDRAHLLGRALYGARRYDDALAAFGRVPKLRLKHLVFAAASCAEAGREAELPRLVAEIERMRQDFSASAFVDTLFYEKEEDSRRLRDSLAKAGLPA